MGYTRTPDAAGRTKTIFLVNGFKNPALRAGQNRRRYSRERAPRSMVDFIQYYSIVSLLLTQLLRVLVQGSEIVAGLEGSAEGCEDPQPDRVVRKQTGVCAAVTICKTNNLFCEYTWVPLLVLPCEQREHCNNTLLN